jgi:hypothetical protein
MPAARVESNPRFAFLPFRHFWACLKYLKSGGAEAADDAIRLNLRQAARAR